MFSQEFKSLMYSLDQEDAPLWKQILVLCSCFLVAVFFMFLLWFAAQLDHVSYFCRGL